MTHIPVGLVSFDAFSAPLLKEGIERDQHVGKIRTEGEVTCGVHRAGKDVMRSQPFVGLLVSRKLRVVTSASGIMRKAPCGERDYGILSTTMAGPRPT